MLGEYTLNGTQYKPVIEYIWLEDQPVAAVRPTPGAPANAGNSAQEVFYLHTDHLGTPRIALDTAGRVRWRWMGGEPFGVNPAENNPEGLGELNLSLRLPGQQYDGFVGLHYNYFRDYDPTVGRYVQSDPIGLAGGINTYAYVGGNPISRVDPTGLEPPAGAVALRDYFRSIFPASRDPSLRPDGLPCGYGCGDAKTDSLVPDFFPKACEAHDQCYADQGGKDACDTKFKKDMKAEKPGMSGMASFYYWAVYFGGGGAYRSAGTKP
ncbi:RHS repeat-associated core domain-containing protein [Roseateles sp.]|uniref:RHS repeat-associated core domain-containing protein n=1 Tax=Roseateles sp. TaxID=1971397 RepID=UPI003D11DAF7